MAPNTPIPSWTGCMRKLWTRGKIMKTCETCNNYFCAPTKDSPCGQCLTRRGRTGWQPMGWRTRLRRWISRARR